MAQTDIVVFTTNYAWKTNKKGQLPISVIDVIPAKGWISYDVSKVAPTLGAGHINWLVNWETHKTLTTRYDAVNTGRKRYK